MANSRPLKRTLGGKRACLRVTVTRSNHIPANHAVVAEMNATLRKKCEEQKVKDAEALKRAANIFAGV